MFHPRGNTFINPSASKPREHEFKMGLIIKKTAIVIVLLGFAGSHPSLAHETRSFPDSGPTPSFPSPLHLKNGTALPDDTPFSKPSPPSKDANGNPLETKNTAGLPDLEVMNDLTDPAVLDQILRVDRVESAKNRYHWHASVVWSYCHFRDQKGNHWYGWKTGPQFHWLLFKKGLYWWHDANAGRWLYFHKGYWWWPDKRNQGQCQVYENDGHYARCDLQGVLESDGGSYGDTTPSNLVSTQALSGPSGGHPGPR
jgi:hypothetical protein